MNTLRYILLAQRYHTPIPTSEALTAQLGRAPFLPQLPQNVKGSVKHISTSSKVPEEMLQGCL